MIWIIGNRGMLGQELSRTLTDAGLDVIGSDREVSILEPEELDSFYSTHKPEWIVNCSAYTAVDKAESDIETAYALNRDGVKNIAVLARNREIPLIHISTDYVFDGTSSLPLNEEAVTGPTGVYGASKLAGEEEIRKICPQHIIIRTAWLYGQFGPNFVYTMLKLMNKLEALKVISDQMGSPTWAKELAGVIKTVISGGKTAWGTYHYSGEDQCSWHDFACKIYEEGKAKGLISSDCRVNSCTSEEFPTAARRPAYSLLDKHKIKETFHIQIPVWQESLKTFIKGINHNDII